MLTARCSTPAVIGLWIVVALMPSPRPARAQDEGLAFLIGDLIRTVRLDTPGELFPSFAFSSESSLEALNQSFNAAFSPQLASFPLGSPGGGFTFVYDPDLGTFERGSNFFGSRFVERAQTIGKGKWNAGLSFQSVEFNKIGDLGLDNGDLLLQLRLDEDPVLGFQSSLIGATTTIDVSTDTSVLFVTYGATKKIDFSVGLPYVHTELSARADLLLDPVDIEGTVLEGNFVFCEAEDNPMPAPCGSTTSDGLFLESQNAAIAQRSGSASGIGDVLLRGKFRFSGKPKGGFGALLDVRLPTGDEKELLGSGVTQVRPQLVGSTEAGIISPYFNLGYTFSSGSTDLVDDVPNEVNLSGGIEIAPSSRVTFSLDAIGRRLLDASQLVRFQDQEFPHPGNPPLLRDNIGTVKSDLDIWMGAAGLRWNIASTWLLSLNGLFSISNDGLEEKGPIVVLAIERSF